MRNLLPKHIRLKRGALMSSKIRRQQKKTPALIVGLLVYCQWIILFLKEIAVLKASMQYGFSSKIYNAIQ